MFQKVLVPLDGSELAEGILPYVSQLTRGMRIPVLLLSVVDPDAVGLPGGQRVRPKADGSGQFVSAGIGNSASEARVFEEIGIEVERALDAVVRRLSDEGAQAQSVVSFGAPAEEIVRIADKEGCDLIAMSTHGRSALARGILGSVTDRVIHISHLPTLTITPDRAKQYWQESLTISRILVPLDGSELAESVLPYVEHLAQKLSLEVLLVRAAHMGSVRAPYSSTYLYYSRHVDVDTELEKDAAEYLEGVSNRLTSKGLTVEWKVLKGAPAFAIHELARATSHDILALATHGRSGLRRWILGSVTESVVRGSGDPVLVIPPDGANG